jgi:hypothetical protein
MSERANRDELLAIIDEERDHWLSLMAEIGPERMTGEIVDGRWEMRDLIAHLVIWRGRTMGIVTAQALGLPQPDDPWPAELSDDLDVINAWIDGQDRHEPAQSLVEAYTASFSQMRNLIERLDDDALNDPNRVPFLIGLSVAEAFSSRLLFGHLREEHEPAIWAFIGRSGSIAS